MAPRKILWVVAAGVVLLIAVWYVRPIRHARLVGVDWQSDVRTARCVTRWREVVCTTIQLRKTLPADYTTVQFNPITRGIHRVDRIWSPPDSDRWHQLMDSIQQAAVARHAEPIPCDTSETGFAVADAWRLGNEEERLYAAPIRKTARHDAFWYVDAQLVPLGAAGCGRELRWRLLTPAEMEQRLRDWIGERIGF